MNSLLDDLEALREEEDYGTLTSGVMACAGFATWTGVALADAAARAAGGGEFELREAWDSQLYVYAALPLLMFAAAIAGFLLPRGAWRWPVWLACGHFAGLLLLSLPTSGASLLPMGLMLFAGGMVFLLVPAYLGALGAWAAGRI